MSELQLGAKVMLAPVGSETKRERPSLEWARLRLEAYPDIVANDPFSLLIAQVAESRRPRGVGEQRIECPFAVVVVLAFEIGDTLTLHVRLASQDEDLKRQRGIGRSSGRDGDSEKRSYQPQAFHT